MDPEALKLITILISILTGGGIMFAGVGYGYAQIKQGSGKAKDEIIATYKEQAVAERQKAERLAEEKVTLVSSHQVQINDLNTKLGKLEGLYQAAENSKKEYLAIFQGRDPEQKKFMEFMVISANHTTEVLTEIKTFMALMNGEIAKGNLFNKQVEQATKDGTGKTLRKNT